MSTPILPFAVWASGTNQNSIPANDNSLRNQILNGYVISDSTDAQPGSPSDGDIYIITGSATGTQWATFSQYDLAIYSGGTWYAFAPVTGIIVNIAGSLYKWTGSAYTSASGGGVSLGAVNVFTKNQSVATVALTDGTNIATDASLANNFKVTLGGNRTLDNPTNLTEGMILNWIITQDGTGSRTLAYGSKFKWPGGTAPTLSTAAAAVDMISAYYDGTNLLCAINQAFA